MRAFHPLTQRQVIVVARKNDERNIEVSLTDRGIGIGTERMPWPFAPFFTTQPFGTGIGLSIGRMIIDSRGGKMWPENDGTGRASARFWLAVHIA